MTDCVHRHLSQSVPNLRRTVVLPSCGLSAANQNSDTIVTFRVDQATGKLTPTRQVVKTGSPSCIVLR